MDIGSLIALLKNYGLQGLVVVGIAYFLLKSDISIKYPKGR